MSEEKQETNLKAVICTDGGCMQHTGKGGWGIHGTIGEYTYDGWGAILPQTTNNEAELQAAIEGIKLATRKEATDLTIRTDSRYVMDNFLNVLPKWEKNGWIKSDGNPVANQSYWKELRLVHNQAIDNGTSVKWEWVRGHNGDRGNEFADENASKAVILAQKGLSVTNMSAIETKKHGKFKTPDRNHMINCPRWFFMGSAGKLYSKDGRHIYHCGFSDKDDELNGKPISDAYQSVVFLKEPEEVLDAVREYQDSILDGGNHVVFGRVDNITSPKVYHEILDNGHTHLTYRGPYKEVTDVNKLPLTRAARPPGLAFNLVQLLHNYEQRLERYIKDGVGEGENITDITHLIYEVDDNPKKTKILPHVDTSLKALETSITHFPDVETNIILTLGLDLPRRNSLAKLAKLSPKVSILSWTESESSFRYATIVETKDDIGIYVAGYSNLRII